MKGRQELLYGLGGLFIMGLGDPGRPAGAGVSASAAKRIRGDAACSAAGRRSTTCRG